MKIFKRVHNHNINRIFCTLILLLLLLTLYRHCRIFQSHVWLVHNIVAAPLHRPHSNLAQIASKSLEPKQKSKHKFNMIFTPLRLNIVAICYDAFLPYPCLASELEFHHRHSDYCVISVPLLDLHFQTNSLHLRPAYELFENFHLQFVLIIIIKEKNHFFSFKRKKWNNFDKKERKLI